MNSDMFSLVFSLKILLTLDALLHRQLTPISFTRAILCLVCELKREKRLVLSLVNVKALDIKTFPKHCT